MKTRYRIVGILALCFAAGAYGAIAQGQTSQPQTGQSTAQSPEKPQPAKPAAEETPSKSHQKKGQDQPDTATNASVEPDKVLYQRALYDIKKSRYTEGRLAYQTLINTYPDSEYLAKAKLGVADSYYKEGGTSNFIQAVAEYKDFITFFPFLDEAPYAQLQIGMAYYRMMEKADRDNSQAEQTEDALQTFILKYPQSPLLPKAEQQLRNVQEILAEGQYFVARFYYLKQDYRPAAARLFELTERYPLYSQSDEALWMLGDIYFRAKKVSKSEDDQNHWSDLAGDCYSRIITNYPGSKLVPAAKDRLKAMNMPIPKPDPNALAMMKEQQLYNRQHERHGLLHVSVRGTFSSMVSGTPDFSAAARFGVPTLVPPDDNISPLEVLKPGAVGPDFNLSARQVTSPDEAAPAASGEISNLTSAGPAADQAPSGASVQAQIISGNSGSADPPSSAASDSGTSQALPSPLTPDTSAAGQAAEPSGALPAPLTPSTASPVDPNGNATATPAPSGSSSVTAAPTPQAATGSTASQQEAPQAESTKADKSTESSSKKKKGVHKLIPF